MNWTPRRSSNEQYLWTEQGQRTDNERVHGRESRLAEDNDYTYRYDNEGNMVRRTLKSNSAKSTEYLYDALGRLSKVVCEPELLRS